MVEYLKLEFIKVSESRVTLFFSGVWSSWFCFVYRFGIWEMFGKCLSMVGVGVVVLGVGGLFKSFLLVGDLLFFRCFFLVEINLFIFF